MDFPVFVVLPGSGVGLRFGTPTPKQYTCIKDKPLFLYTVHAFHRLPWVRSIVVVVAPGDVAWVQELLEKNHLTRVRVTPGGKTRHRSIYSGVQALRNVCRGNDVVLIHDIVRVLAEESVVMNVAKAAKLYGAAGITRPLTSTVIAKDSDGFLCESLDRTKYLASEMPQGFHYDVINTAYEKATEYDFDFGTECLHLASKYVGTKASLVEGLDNLWKVTYRKDLFAAEGILTENLSSIFIEEGSSHYRESIVAGLTRENLMVSSDNSPLCGDSGFVFFLPQGSSESDRATKMCNIRVVMEKITADHFEKDSDRQSYGSLPDSQKKGVSISCDSSVQTEEKVCSKCSFLANKTVIVLIEINRADRGREIENIRERLLETPFPDKVYVFVVVFHKESNLDTLGDMTASLLRNQHPGMNYQIYYAQ